MSKATLFPVLIRAVHYGVLQCFFYDAACLNDRMRSQALHTLNKTCTGLRFVRCYKRLFVCGNSNIRTAELPNYNMRLIISLLLT